MKNKNYFALLCLVGLMIVGTNALASCGPKNDVIKIWAWNKNVDAINEGIKTYQEQVNANFHAKVESFARLDIDKKFKTASQNGNYDNIGDIVLCDGMNILNYYDLWSNIFTDLSSYVSDEEKGKFVQSTLDTVSVDNKLIGLPLDVAPTVVFANKTLWDEATLQKVKTNGWTWEEYETIGQSIRKAKGEEIFMTAYDMRGDDRIYRTMTSQKGEWFMDKEYNVFVGNENSVTAMTRIKNMMKSHTIGHIDTGNYKSLMKNNKIAAQIQGFFLGGQLKDVAPEMAGLWEVLPLPKWNKDDISSASITGGSYLYANSNMKSSKLDSAVDFIKWMTLNEKTSIQSLKDAGVYPALKTAYDEPYFKETKDPYYVNDSVWADAGKWSSDAKAIIATKYNGFNYDIFIKCQEKILFSETEVVIKEELLNTARVMRDNAK